MLTLPHKNPTTPTRNLIPKIQHPKIPLIITKTLKNNNLKTKKPYPLTLIKTKTKIIENINIIKKYTIIKY